MVKLRPFIIFVTALFLLGLLQYIHAVRTAKKLMAKRMRRFR
jgi:hypothetical protein